MCVNWKHIFDWSVEKVSEPYLLQLRGMNLPIYAVDVKFVHHGTWKRIFITDDFNKNTSYGIARTYVATKRNAKTK